MDPARMEIVRSILRETREYIKTIQAYYADRRPNRRNLEAELLIIINHMRSLRVLENVMKQIERMCQDDLGIVQWDKDTDDDDAEDHPEGSSLKKKG